MGVKSQDVKSEGRRHPEHAWTVITVPDPQRVTGRDPAVRTTLSPGVFCGGVTVSFLQTLLRHAHPLLRVKTKGLES